MNTFFPSTPTIVDSNRILYTASPFARSSLLYLQEIGELEALQAHTSKREKLNSYLFFAVISGAGELEYQGRKYELIPGSCAFINCNLPYSHTTYDELWTIRWIHFNGLTMDSIYSKYCDRGGQPTFVPESTKKMIQIWSDLMSIVCSSDYMRDMKINVYISDLLANIMAESWHPESIAKTPKRQSIQQVKEYLEKHYTEKVTLDELSTLFFIDKFYLGKMFRSQFGMNISSFIQNLRITHAKRLLRFSQKTIEDIGYEVGIGAPNYFCRVFKEVEGITPSKYREQW